MQFASPLPWWLVLVVAAGIGAVAFLSYRRPLAPLRPYQQRVLIALRALTLAIVVAFACRPVVFTTPIASGDLVVPVLVDVSRSMRIADADGETRLERARTLVSQRIGPALEGHARVELLAVGQTLEATAESGLKADARGSDLTGMLAAARDRFRGRAVPGIVLISDGGNTGAPAERMLSNGERWPIFAVGVGSPAGPPDREVLGMTAADPALDQASVDLHVSVLSRGFARAPFQLRVSANGQLIETRTVTPAADGTPADEVFTVVPNQDRATVFEAAIAADAPDAVPENDTRAVLVRPAGRKRRLLLIAGAPGYDQSFLTRALSADPGFEIDSIVRKGRNDENQDTYLVQAGGQRASLLTTGFPATREALFAYDALILANVDADAFSRAQLEMAADFVSVRGGGLVVLGGRSFEQRGLIGTPLESVLPVELSDRRGGGVPRQTITDEGPVTRNGLSMTDEGRRHPLMRIGASEESSRTMWETLPPLAAAAALGGPRAGASVLAVTSAPSGALLPVIAVQRFGAGRAMVFGGEASWRWRMMLPASDRRYEFIWRQALRWLSMTAPDPVSVIADDHAEGGDTLTIDIDVRNPAFQPVADATVSATWTTPDGRVQPLTVRPAQGRYATQANPDRAGLYRVQIDARTGTTTLGSAERWIHVGGADREFADPRLNEPFLQRLAADSGGRYATSATVADAIQDLIARAPQQLERRRRDLWHEPWAFALVIGFLAAEWLLRRRWGLR